MTSVLWRKPRVVFVPVFSSEHMTKFPHQNLRTRSPETLLHEDEWRYTSSQTLMPNQQCSVDVHLQNILTSEVLHSHRVQSEFSQSWTHILEKKGVLVNSYFIHNMKENPHQYNHLVLLLPALNFSTIFSIFLSPRTVSGPVRGFANTSFAQPSKSSSMSVSPAGNIISHKNILKSIMNI